MSMEHSPKPKVMVVDDSALVLKLVRGVLEGAGYAVVTLDSGLNAAAAILREKPALILLDLAMPALRGDKAAEFLRKHSCLEDTILVLHSDRPLDELERAVKSCGADGCIQKSMDMEGMVRRITDLLARRAGSAVR